MTTASRDAVLLLESITSPLRDMARILAGVRDDPDAAGGAYGVVEALITARMGERCATAIHNLSALTQLFNDAQASTTGRLPLDQMTPKEVENLIGKKDYSP